MNFPGTTLIEVIIYLALSMIIITGTGRLMINTYTSIASHTKRNDTLIQLSCALQYFAHDVTNATSMGFTPKVLASNQCIFTLDGTDCGWLVKKGRLMRYRGHYDVPRGTWRHRSVSMIAGTGTNLALAYIFKNTILTGIHCTLRNDAIKVSQFICTKGAYYE